MTFDIDKLNEKQLIELNRKIVERLRFLEQMKAHHAMMRYNIGQRVSFDDANQRPVTGILTRFNKKTVTVISDDGRRWNVSPGFLRDPEPRDVTPGAANVIPMNTKR